MVYGNFENQLWSITHFEMKVCKDVAILKDEETTTNSSMYVNKVPKENKAE